MPSEESEFSLRRLSESEIQDRLYGEYHTGRRRRRSVDTETAAIPAKPPRPAAFDERPWTGQEILKSELDRITRELATLRREKETLAARTPAEQWTFEPPEGGSGSGLWAMAGGVIVAAAVLAVACHTVILEAQPPLLGHAPGTLYSVQVGVYHVKDPAQRLADQLGRDGHPAFLVPVTSRQGKTHYRVYVGRYASKVEAQVQLDRLRRNPILADSFILQRN